MATYSVGTTGYRPQNPFAIKTLTIPDTSLSNSGTVSAVSAAGPFSVQQAIMSSGDLVLIRRQDQSIGRYRIDAERSTSGYIVFLPA